MQWLRLMIITRSVFKAIVIRRVHREPLVSGGEVWKSRKRSIEKRDRCLRDREKIQKQLSWVPVQGLLLVQRLSRRFSHHYSLTRQKHRYLLKLFTVWVKSSKRLTSLLSQFKMVKKRRKTCQTTTSLKIKQGLLMCLSLPRKWPPRNPTCKLWINSTSLWPI